MATLLQNIRTTAIAASLLAASGAGADVLIRYESCGFRSLEWAPVAGAATYKVERRVCDGCLGEWKLVAQTQSTEANDADDPSLEYRVRAVGVAGNIISTQSAAGDGRQVHRLSAPATGTSTISLRGTDVCSSTPQLSISGAWTDLGGNRICDCAGDLNGDRRIDEGDIGMGACGN